MALRWRNTTKASLQPNPFTSSAPQTAICSFDLSLRSDKYSSGQLEKTEWCIDLYQPSDAVSPSITTLKLAHLNCLLQTKIAVTEGDKFYYINHENEEKPIKDDADFCEAVKFANYRYITQKKCVTFVLASGEIVLTSCAQNEVGTRAQSPKLAPFHNLSIRSHNFKSVFPPDDETIRKITHELVEYGTDWSNPMFLVTPDIRKDVTLKFVRAICPPRYFHDSRLIDTMRSNLVPYVQKIESYLYEEATGKSVYCYLVLRKIYKIRRIIEKKWSKQQFVTSGDEIQTIPIKKAIQYIISILQTVKNDESSSRQSGACSSNNVVNIVNVSNSSPFSMNIANSAQSDKRKTAQTAMSQLSTQYKGMNEPGPSGIAASAPDKQPTNEKQIESKTDDADVDDESIPNHVACLEISSPGSSSSSELVSKYPDNMEYGLKLLSAIREGRRQITERKADTLERNLYSLDAKMPQQQKTPDCTMMIIDDEIRQNRAESPEPASSDFSSSFEFIDHEISRKDESIRSNNFKSVFPPGDETTPKITNELIPHGVGWYNSMVTPDMRENLTNTIVRGICPSWYSHDSRLINTMRCKLMPYVQEIENIFYKVTKDKSLYYHLVLRKMSKIRNIVEDKLSKQQFVTSEDEIQTTPTEKAIQYIISTLQTVKNDESSSRQSGACSSNNVVNIVNISNTSPFSTNIENSAQSDKRKTTPGTVMSQLSKQFNGMNEPDPSGIAASTPDKQPTNEKQIESKTDDVGADDESIQNRVACFKISSAGSSSSLGCSLRNAMQEARDQRAEREADTLEQNLSSLDAKMTQQQKTPDCTTMIVDDELSQNRAESPEPASSDSSSSFEFIDDEISRKDRGIVSK